MRKGIFSLTACDHFTLLVSRRIARAYTDFEVTLDEHKSLCATYTHFDFHGLARHRPFDPQYYEDEFEDEEMLDEEGRTRLKLKVCVFIGKCVCSRHVWVGVEVKRVTRVETLIIFIFRLICRIIFSNYHQ